jgi:hypothetical protein
MLPLLNDLHDINMPMTVTTSQSNQHNWHVLKASCWRMMKYLQIIVNPRLLVYYINHLKPELV